MKSPRRPPAAKQTLPYVTGPAAPPSPEAPMPMPSPEVSPPVVGQGAESEDRPATLPFLVVGIGVAADGIADLRALLGSLPPHTGMALVVIPAGTARVPSELLRELTTLPVREAATGITPEPNHLYVAPPDATLHIEKGAFVVAARPADAPGPLVVDTFLCTLAADLRNRAIAVVLAGCAGDGALGRKAVKGEGGIAIVQKPEDAVLHGRPANIPLREYVDLALPPDQIGEELGRIAGQLDRMLTHFVDLTERNPEEPLLSKIYVLLQKAKRVDFSFYKQTTLRRRIARRMVVKHIGTLADYVHHLQADPGELKDLYEDMLINVTRFFRDPDTFAELRAELLPLLLQERPPGETLRIWVPGCATGEEVYSLAITLLEHLEALPFYIPIQLFGTDISDRSIEIARTASYAEKLVTEISPERLQRFFIKAEGGYQVAKWLRDMCVFARQNLASDPPFSRLDLVSCRNVLIYFGPVLQKTIIATFHYALKNTGFLLLGNAETIRDQSNLFALVDKRHRFYAKNPTAERPVLQLGGRAIAHDPPDLTRNERSGTRAQWSEVELQRAADRVVLARFGPAGVIVNEQGEILQSRGHTSPYIELPSGTATLNLLRMVKKNIASELRAGFGRAVADNLPVRLGALPFAAGARPSTMAIEILPILSLEQNPRCFLVLFVPDLVPPAVPPPSLLLPSSAADKEQELVQLHQAANKFYLQTLLEERDIANQELISDNEEMQSNNDELQSLNEELETAKEELQSTNEELQTVNDELYNRNLALGQLSNDLLNLLNNITIPVLMLDGDLRIRQFTPAAERMMNVRSTDIGRPIGEIRLNLNLDNLEPLLAEVIATLATKELEVQDRAGRWHLLRSRPYRTADNKIDGVVIVLVEIDQIRKTQQQLVEARNFSQAVIASAQVPLTVLDPGLGMKLVNHAFSDLCGLPFSEVEGHSFCELAVRCWNLRTIQPLLEALIDQPRAQSEFELEHETSGTNLQILQINARAMGVEGERMILVAVQNVTARKLAERLLRNEKERLEGRVAVTERALDRTQEELRALAASLFNAQEEERRRVSRELHDDLAQKVALLDLTTERIQQALRAMSPNVNLDTQMEELRQQITELAQDLRRIAYRLHPTILDDLGLVFALKQLCEEFGQRENLPVQFTTRTPPNVPVPIGGALYRITQEALRNIAKHAGKTAVEVSLVGARAELRLKICDHGIGFEPGEARGRGGMGILNMEERVRLLGGRFTLKASPGKGVTVTVRVALPSAGNPQ